MTKRWVLGFLIFWGSLWGVFADGKVFPPTAYALPDIPEQQALIHYANGIEKRDAESLIWLLPCREVQKTGVKFWNRPSYNRLSPPPMRHRRFIICSLIGLLMLLAAVLFVSHFTSREEAQIRARYHQMRTALSANDTNAAAALVAPQHRKRFQLHGFSTLNNFAAPLGPRSSILIWGDEATVWPERTSHYLVIPGGNTVGMVKMDGDWFFTGDVHIDWWYLANKPVWKANRIRLLKNDTSMKTAFTSIQHAQSIAVAK